MKKYLLLYVLLFHVLVSSCFAAGGGTGAGTVGSNNRPQTATQAEMEVGTVTSLRSVSPWLVKAAIDALSSSGTPGTDAGDVFVWSGTAWGPVTSNPFSITGLTLTGAASPTEGEKPLKISTAGVVGTYSDISIALQENHIQVGTGVPRGGPTTEVGVTSIGSNVWRFTFLSGTDPLFGCQPGETPAGTLLKVNVQNIDAADNGVFTVTSCGNDAVDGHDWFQVTNPSGVASTGTIGTGYINVDTAAASALDTNLAAVSATDNTVASAKAVKQRILHKTFSFDPKAVCDGAVDRLFLMSTGSSEAQGIIVTAWKVSFEADPTTEADLDLKRADAFIGVANAAVMDVIDTTTGAASESTAANINGGAAVAMAKVLYLEFGTAYTETTHQVIFEMWYYEVGS